MKRFTDTEIWKRPWFRRLTPAEKCAWLFITDHCDNVGVWIPDTEAAEFFIGESVDWNSLLEHTNGNIEVLENGKWWLCDFILFQHSDTFSCTEERQSNACKSYVALLKTHDLYDRFPALFQAFGKPSASLAQGYRERERVKVKVEVGEKERENVAVYENEFNETWSKYPRKKNRKGAYNAYVARRREGVEACELEKAVVNYVSQVKAEGTEEQFVMHGATFFGPNERWKEAKPVVTKINQTKVTEWTCECGASYNGSISFCTKCGKDRV